MRIAFFSPLPPSRSGIADYSEALLGAMRRMAEVETFDGSGHPFDPCSGCLTSFYARTLALLVVLALRGLLVRAL